MLGSGLSRRGRDERRRRPRRELVGRRRQPLSSSAWACLCAGTLYSSCATVPVRRASTWPRPRPSSSHLDRRLLLSNALDRALARPRLHGLHLPTPSHARTRARALLSERAAPVSADPRTRPTLQAPAAACSPASACRAFELDSGLSSPVEAAPALAMYDELFALTFSSFLLHADPALFPGAGSHPAPPDQHQERVGRICNADAEEHLEAVARVRPPLLPPPLFALAQLADVALARQAHDMNLAALVTHLCTCWRKAGFVGEPAWLDQNAHARPLYHVAPHDFVVLSTGTGTRESCSLDLPSFSSRSRRGSRG